MADALLDFFFKVSLSTAPSLANTGYLHNALAIVQANASADTGIITFCQSVAELSQQTDDVAPVQFLNAGGAGIFVLPVAKLSDAAELISDWSDGFTILIGSGWNENDIAALPVGAFKGVIGANFAVQANAKVFAAKVNHCGYNGDIQNMFYAFGKLLSDTTWKNQQALPLPFSDSVTTTASAENKFNDRVSFGLDSEQYGTRLAFFVAGGQAITAPYVIEEIKIMLQSEWMRYAAVNNPAYTITSAKLIEQNLQTRVLDSYIRDGLISFGTITVSLGNDDFVGDATINMERPRAWWRIFATITAE